MHLPVRGAYVSLALRGMQWALGVQQCLFNLWYYCSGQSHILVNWRSKNKYSHVFSTNLTWIIDSIAASMKTHHSSSLNLAQRELTTWYPETTAVENTFLSLLINYCSGYLIHRKPYAVIPHGTAPSVWGKTMAFSRGQSEQAFLLAAFQHFSWALLH